MKKLFLLLIASCLSHASHGGNPHAHIDSIIKALSTSKPDTEKVNTFNQLSKDFIYTNLFPDNNARAMDAANDALLLAKKLNFQKGIANAYNNMGIICIQQANYQEALKNYALALEIRKQIGDKEPIAGTYSNIGNVFFELGDYPNSLKNYLAALRLAEEVKDSGMIAIACTRVGDVYSQQGNYREAFKNCFAALNICQRKNDKHGILVINENIGNIFLQQKNYEEALKYFSNSLEQQPKFGDSDKIIKSGLYADIGDVYIHEGKYNGALKNYQTALKIEEQKNYKYGIADSYINIGEIYRHLHNNAEAKTNLLKGLSIARENEIKDEMKDAYYFLSQLDSVTGNISDSYRYFKLYVQMKDSIVNEKSNNQISLLNVQYETEKKEKEIMLLNKNNEIKTVKIGEQKAVVKYLIGGFSLVIVFSIVAFWLYNQKRAVTFKHKILEAEMRALRSQMNPHFTFNVLNSIQYYVSENDMESAELYLEKFSSLIRMILEQSRIAYITLEQEVSILKLYLELEEMRFEKKFTYSMNIDSNIDPNKILIPGMLIQPIIENAIKHGIEHKEGDALINISFSLRSGILICKVTDNGIGRAAAEKLRENKTHKPVASDIIKERMKALSSIYNIRLYYKIEDIFNAAGASEGTCVSMEIPTGKNESLN